MSALLGAAISGLTPALPSSATLRDVCSRHSLERVENWYVEAREITHISCDDS
jgi:hypothetical protein